MSNSLEAKIVVLGSQGIGKTSLVNRYVKNAFAETNLSTVGASFLTKRVLDIDSATVVRLQIWDTAGQERFRSISKLYYRGANAALLCYDITSSTSFTEMGHWLVELRANLPEDTILHVVGTKSDIVAEQPSKRAVPFERVITYVAENLQPTSTTVPQTTTTSNTTKSKSDLSEGHNSARKDGNAHMPLASPHSNRSSMNFWGQDLGWDCCHEVSASTGEGVEEVFRVITRRLVEQRNARAALEQRLLEEFGGMTPAVDERGHAFGEYAGMPPGAGGAQNGSFRVGVGDKRRSWLGLAHFPSLGGSGEDDDEINERKRRKGCC